MNTPAGGVTLPELLPCPFCGGAAVQKREHDADLIEWGYIACSQCGTRTRGKWGDLDPSTWQEIRGEWNTRAALAGEWRVPEGWRLVPVEATREMVRAARNEVMLLRVPIGATVGEEARMIYAAMLSAAPLPKEPGR